MTTFWAASPPTSILTRLDNGTLLNQTVAVAAPLDTPSAYVADVARTNFPTVLQERAGAEVQRNILLNPNAQGAATPPSTITGWTPRGQANANFQQVTFNGGPAFRVIRNTDAAGNQDIYMTTAAMPVATNQWIGAACDMMRATSAGSSDGQLSLIGDGTPVTLTTFFATMNETTWTPATGTIQNTGTSTNVQFRVNFRNAAEGSTYYARKCIMAVGASQAAVANIISSYFDGSFPYCAWTGTAHGSASIKLG